MAITRISLLFLFIFIAFSSFSQVALESLIEAPLGKSYEQDVVLRKKTIKQKYTLTYCKEQNKYILEFEDVPVDNYGNADINFTYLRNSLVSIDLYFKFNCIEYLSLVQIYKELDLTIKQKYKGVIDVLHGFEYELMDKDISDSLMNISVQLKNHIIPENIVLGWDQYKLNKIMFHDNRIVSITIGSFTWEKKEQIPYDNILPSEQYKKQTISKVDTICTQQIELSIYNSNTIETMRPYPSICNDISIIESKENVINLLNESGVYVLQAKLNGMLDNQEFVFDTGASDVTITPDVFLVLYKSGTIKDSDFIGTGTYKLADGSYVKSNRFILHEMKIGDIVLDDVEVSVSNNVQSPMLFGQSAITKLGNYKIDFKNGLLILEN